MFGVGETKRAADEAVRLAPERGVSLDFSRNSVIALDELLLNISRSVARQGSSDDEIWDLACIYGSYLGECMLRNDFGRLGFAWSEDTDGEPCLKPTSKATGSAANLSRSVPITKAYKRIVNGEQDSAAQFYAMTLLMVSDDDCSKALGELGQESMPVEPKYVGANGNVSASAAAWLFCEDVVFFLDEQIAWDGTSHSALGMQINAEKIYSAPALLSSYQTILPGVMDLISNIERDEGLRVPLGMIHPGLHSVLRNEDLTGLTLFNLMACAHALIVKETSPDVYAVICDSRLPAGIPCFYQLVARMIWDMRAYNGRSSACKVGFANARNFDADVLLGEVDEMVPGAFSQAIWQVELAEKPRVKLPDGTEGKTFASKIPHVFASGFDDPMDLQASEELFETVLNQLARDFPITRDIEGTHHMGRIPRIEHVRVGDPLVLAADWQSEWFDPVCIEVFNVSGETLGNLRQHSSFTMSGNRELACLLPHIIATVETVTPKSKRRRNAKYALMDVHMEIDPAVLGEDGKLLPEVVNAAKALLALPKGERVVVSKGSLVASQLKGNIDTTEVRDVPNPIGEAAGPREPAEPGGEAEESARPSPTEKPSVDEESVDVVAKSAKVALDQDMLGRMAYATIFHDGPVDASLMHGLFPELESAEIAECYLDELLRLKVVARSGRNGFESAVTFEEYALDQLDRREAELTREGYYDSIMLALIDYGDYAKLDDMLMSVDGLPGRNEVRALLLEGVEKGDFVRKGNWLTFACVLDEESSQEWKSAAEKRGKQREDELRSIAAKRDSIKKSKKERGHMMRSYKAALKRYEENEAKQREKEAERSRQRDLAAVDLVVDALEGYRLGNGFVLARWVRTNVKDVATVKRAEYLLKLGWQGGRIRRATKDNAFIYARQLTPEEWVPIRDEASARMNAQYDKECKARKAIQLQAIDNNIEFASTLRDHALQRVESLNDRIRRDESLSQEIDEKLKENELAMASLKGDIERMTDELNAAGLFMLSKKKELRTRIGSASDQLEDLRSKNLSLRSNKEALQRRLAMAREELDRRTSELNDKKNELEGFERERESAASEERPEPGSRELIIRMRELSKLWACPVAPAWFHQNVNGIESVEQAESLLRSADGKRYFTQLESGLYAYKGLAAGATNPSTKGKSKKGPIQLQPGSKLDFGQYGELGMSEDLRWTVLDVDKRTRKALLLCDSVLMSEAFSKGKRKATWSNCKLASWLNTEFVGEAFSDVEVSAIVEKRGLRKVFVLSDEEFKRYRKRGHINPPQVPYGVVSKRGSWWLRTSGESEYRAMYVTEKNRLSAKGMSVGNDSVGVRPAIWVDVDMLP